MRNINRYLVLGLVVAMMWSCTYDEPEIAEPSSGELDFTKLVSVGNSLTAGFMDGALYNQGQMNSFPSLLAMQMSQVGGGQFNQPDINSEVGFTGTVPDGMGGTIVLGRLRLVGSTPSPIIPGEIPTPFTGDKTELNNFGVPGITLATALTPLTGDLSAPANPAFNPLYARFASNPGTSTVIEDAAAALADGGTFFTFWLGNNDILGYATGGAANEAILTEVADFGARFDLALNAMLTAAPDAEGVVANIPDVTSIPYFTLVPHNPVPLSAAQVAGLTAGFGGFNAALDGIVAALGHDSDDADQRKVIYAEGDGNPLLIIDESLEDLSSKFDQLEVAGAISAQDRAALQPFVQARPATSDDLIPLPTSPEIGRDLNPAMPGTALLGISVPLEDSRVVTKTELDFILDRTAAFNEIVANRVSSNSDRLALFDANALLNNLVTNNVTINGSGLSASIAPPFGAFSTDGVHPNSRGYAYLANEMIDVINAKFGSSIPGLNPNDYPGNSLPE
ncbi:MAG: hypothetical protein AAF843_14570 [Bacteroidota bacterium]